MQLETIDDFFQDHPLKERYFACSEAERAGTAAVAERDILAATAHCKIESESDKAFLLAAIAEQTVFLMLNPEYLTGCYTRTSSLSSGGGTRRFSDTASPLGQRAAALIAPLLAAAERAEKISANSGNTGNSGNNNNSGNAGDGSTGTGGDTGDGGAVAPEDDGDDKENEFIGILRISRG